jgi:hypothetical protein
MDIEIEPIVDFVYEIDAQSTSNNVETILLPKPEQTPLKHEAKYEILDDITVLETPQTPISLHISQDQRVCLPFATKIQCILMVCKVPKAREYLRSSRYSGGYFATCISYGMVCLSRT